MTEARIAFLWDIDGTLIDAGGAGGGALLTAMKREFQLTEAQMVKLHGRTDRGIIGELLESHGLETTESLREQLCEAYFQLLPSELQRRGGKILPGVPRILDALQAIPACKLGVMTGNMTVSARAKLEHFELWEYFEFGIYGDHATVRPDLKEPAQLAVAEHFGDDHPTDQVIVIGDTPLDIELAKLLGARSLGVCTGGIPGDDLEKAGADWVVEDLRDTDAILDWFFHPFR